MTVTKVYCDHCGQEIDEMKDFGELELFIKGNIRCDLCAGCLDELQEVVENFVSPLRGASQQNKERT